MAVKKTPKKKPAPKRRRTRPRFLFAKQPYEIIFKFRGTKKTCKALRAMADADPADFGTATHEFGPLGDVLADAAVRSIAPVYRCAGATPSSPLEHLLLTVDSEDDEKYRGLNVVQVTSLDIAKTLCESLCNDPKIEYAYVADQKVPSASVDPLRNRQWAFTAIDYSAALQLPEFQSGDGIRIGVIDTGVDTSHPDLDASRIVTETFLPGFGNGEDTSGHGTHVIGIIAAVVNNDVGIAGLTQGAELYSLKALDPFSFAAYLSALRFAIEDAQVHVLNLSLEGYRDHIDERLLIAEAIAEGIFVVAAMGNLGTDIPAYPAAFPDVIAVGASTETDESYADNNEGDHVDLVAPGVNILSTVPGDPRFDVNSGTSMAAAVVTATVALARSMKPTISLLEMFDALHQGADPVPGQTEHSPVFGHGRLNVHKTLALL